MPRLAGRGMFLIGGPAATRSARAARWKRHSATFAKGRRGGVMLIEHSIWNEPNSLRAPRSWLLPPLFEVDLEVIQPSSTIDQSGDVFKPL